MQDEKKFKQTARTASPRSKASNSGRRIQVRKSGIHGKGVYAIRPIKAGEELSYDYGLVIDARRTSKLKKEYACLCRANNCRGTMLNCK